MGNATLYVDGEQAGQDLTPDQINAEIERLEQRRVEIAAEEQEAQRQARREQYAGQLKAAKVRLDKATKAKEKTDAALKRTQEKLEKLTQEQRETTDEFNMAFVYYKQTEDFVNDLSQES
jgi:hypothetical protein